MPRPIRLRKPSSAPTATSKPTTTATTVPVKKATITATTTTILTKSRTTRSGTKDIPDNEPSAGLPTPSSKDVARKSTLPKKTSANVVKRPTRSKVATDDSIVRASSPRKQPTTRQRKPAAKGKVPEPEPQPEKDATPTPTPTPTPTLLAAVPSPLPPSPPEIQVPASSDAENRSPQHFASSPPVFPSTPSRVKRRVVLEWGPDAGYSPPPTKQTSAQRPRLRELEPISLEPLGSVLPENLLDEEEIDETIDRASPTPRRGRKSGFLPPPSDEDYENEAPTSAQPFHRVLPPLTGGQAFFVEGDEEAFIIYSDPKSPTPSLPSAGPVDENMRPPESSPETTPAGQRKRRSSGVVVDSDEDINVGAVEDETELAADRKGKKRKGKAQKEKGGLVPTSILMDLLPRRKKSTRHGPVDEFDILSTSEENQQEENEDEGEDEGRGSEDELSKPAGRVTRSGRNPKIAVKTTKAKGKKIVGAAGKGLTEKVNAKTKGKGKTRGTSVASIAITKSAWSKPLVGKPGKTYGRRSIGSEKENASPNRNKGESDETGSSSDTIVIGDGVLEKQGRRKLKEAAEKFKEVDRWELEFEDISPRSLETESEGAR